MYLRNVIAASVSGIVCLGASISAASAQGYSWTGVSVYAGGGGHELDADVNIRDTSTFTKGIVCEETKKPGKYDRRPCREHRFFSKEAFNAIASVLNGDPGIFGTVGVGADVEATPGLVVGAFADIDFSNADADLSGSSTSIIKQRRRRPRYTVTGSTSVNGSLDHDYSYTIGGRVGVLSLDRSALLYVLAGYTRLETGGTVQVNDAINFHFRRKNFGFAGMPISVNLPDSFDGYTVGLGGQVKLTQAWSIKLEGRYSGFQSKSVSYSKTTNIDKTLGYSRKGCGSKYHSPCERILRKTVASTGTIDVDPEIYSLRAVIAFSF